MGDPIESGGNRQTDRVYGVVLVLDGYTSAAKAISAENKDIRSVEIEDASAEDEAPSDLDLIRQRAVAITGEELSTDPHTLVAALQLIAEQGDERSRSIANAAIRD